MGATQNHSDRNQLVSEVRADKLDAYWCSWGRQVTGACAIFLISLSLVQNRDGWTGRGNSEENGES
jgi:hypothetical protein